MDSGEQFTRLLVRNQKRIWGFILSLVPNGPDADVGHATLQLTATPSGRGFASKTSDTTFAAYGVLDDSLDDWMPEQVTWQQLPGVLDDPSKTGAVQLLGHFAIPQGQQSGSFLVEGHKVADLVRNDSNQLITILLVSETESFKGMLWHAFVSSRHETLRPPTLRLQFEN